MGVLQELGGLSFEAKATILIPIVATVVVAAVLEIRRSRERNADKQEAARVKKEVERERQEAAARQKQEALREKRAIIRLEREHSNNRGAAFRLGRSDFQDPPLGQHFHASIKNDGPYMAEDIEVA